MRTNIKSYSSENKRARVQINSTKKQTNHSKLDKGTCNALKMHDIFNRIIFKDMAKKQKKRSQPSE